MNHSVSKSMQLSNRVNEKNYNFSTSPSSYPINLHNVESVLSNNQRPVECFREVRTSPAPEFSQRVPAGNSRTASLSGSNAALIEPKPGKKRARVSRRAPTTVLTTDTNNFRAMVQEFTGIPQFSRTSNVEIYGEIASMEGSPLLKPSSSIVLQPFTTPTLSSQSSFLASSNETTMTAGMGTNALPVNHLKQGPLLHFGALPMTGNSHNFTDFEKFVGASMPSSVQLSSSPQTTGFSRNGGEVDVANGCPYGSCNGERFNKGKVSFNGYDDSSTLTFHDDKCPRNGDNLME